MPLRQLPAKQAMMCGSEVWRRSYMRDMKGLAECNSFVGGLLLQWFRQRSFFVRIAGFG
jgi:hypothetical protein